MLRNVGKLKELNTIYFYVAIAVVSVIFFFSRIYEPSLSGDEAKYALIAKNMLKSKNFLIPNLGFENYFKKPPLFFWLIALSFKIFGFSEFSARFPSALFGTLDALLIFYLTHKITGDKLVSLFSSLIFIINFEVIRITTIVRFDSFLLFVNLASLILLFKPTSMKIILSTLLISAGAMAKGPVAFISLISLSGYSFLRKKWKILSVYTIIGLISLLPLSVYLILLSKQHPQLVSEFLGKQIFGRIEGTLNEGTPRSFFFYEKIIAKHFWMWNLALFYLPYLLFKRNFGKIKSILKVKERELFIVFFLSFLIPFVALHFVSLKFTRYSYYLYPFLGFITSLIITRTKLLKPAVVYSIFVISAYGLAALICPCHFHKDKIKDIRPLIEIGLKNFKSVGIDKSIKTDLVYPLLFYYDKLKSNRGKFMLASGKKCLRNPVLVYKNYCIVRK